MAVSRGKLSLYRKSGQRIVVGNPPDHIIITVKATDENSVTLIIDAEKNVPIYREELLRTNI